MRRVEPSKTPYPNSHPAPLMKDDAESATPVVACENPDFAHPLLVDARDFDPATHTALPLADAVTHAAALDAFDAATPPAA